MTASQAFGTLQVPAHWQTVDLISDLHLQASEMATFEAWRDYMACTRADAVLILGEAHPLHFLIRGVDFSKLEAAHAANINERNHLQQSA